jgi:hypothetical protein
MVELPQFSHTSLNSTCFTATFIGSSRRHERKTNANGLAIHDYRAKSVPNSIVQKWGASLRLPYPTPFHEPSVHFRRGARSGIVSL